METVKAKIPFVYLAILFLAGAAVGRYTLPERVKIEKETVTVEQKTEDDKSRTNTNTDRDKHRETTVTEIVRPDGTVERTTKTTEDTQTKRVTDTDKDVHSTDNTTQSVKETHETVRGSSPVLISFLVGTTPQFNGGVSTGPVVYGGSIVRPILGPVTLGLFGTNQPTFGFSIGLMF